MAPMVHILLDLADMQQVLLGPMEKNLKYMRLALSLLLMSTLANN